MIFAMNCYELIQGVTQPLPYDSWEKLQQTKKKQPLTLSSGISRY